MKENFNFLFERNTSSKAAAAAAALVVSMSAARTEESWSRTLRSAAARMRGTSGPRRRAGGTLRRAPGCGARSGGAGRELVRAQRARDGLALGGHHGLGVVVGELDAPLRCPWLARKARASYWRARGRGGVWEAAPWSGMEAAWILVKWFTAIDSFQWWGMNLTSGVHLSVRRSA